jgi:hypothetical protein
MKFIECCGTNRDMHVIRIHLSKIPHKWLLPAERESLRSRRLGLTSGATTAAAADDDDDEDDHYCNYMRMYPKLSGLSR